MKARNVKLNRSSQHSESTPYRTSKYGKKHLQYQPIQSTFHQNKTLTQRLVNKHMGTRPAKTKQINLMAFKTN